MKDLHVKIPEPLYKFLAKESGNQGISYGSLSDKSSVGKRNLIEVERYIRDE